MDTCIFCNIKDEDIICHNTYWFAKFDNFPVNTGHILIIPYRHAETYFDLNDNEINALNEIIKLCKNIIDIKYKPDGYNIGANCGISGGQTIMHCHIHLIPRYKGDCENPKGGVRGVIPNKQKY